ncbi:MAG: hypothetical protein EB101_05260 [Chitinophagia bacterium]|nr:hypothetical protein [Chitinophagia bacterium]
MLLALLHLAIFLKITQIYTLSYLYEQMQHLHHLELVLGLIAILEAITQEQLFMDTAQLVEPLTPIKLVFLFLLEPLPQVNLTLFA